MSDELDFLLRPRSAWIDIQVSVLPVSNGFRVDSVHRDARGNVMREFQIDWPGVHKIGSEYACGISLIHDVKDHIFYGLGITDLTEFQTIVQTYYGRWLAGGCVPPDGHLHRITGAIADELFGPRGSRVYDPSARGLLAQHLPGLSDVEKVGVFTHLVAMCCGLMLPRIADVYARNGLALALQRSTLDQPELVDHYLSDVRWLDRDRRLLDLADNVGLVLNARAYVDEDLLMVTRSIATDLEAYLSNYGILCASPFLDVGGYVTASVP